MNQEDKKKNQTRCETQGTDCGSFQTCVKKSAFTFTTQIFNDVKILKTHKNSFMKKLADGQFVARISRKEVLMSCIDILKRPHASKKNSAKGVTTAGTVGAF